MDTQPAYCRVVDKDNELVFVSLDGDNGDFEASGHIF